MQDHGILSLAPAILAIVLAIVTRNVIVSLFSAVALGGIIHIGVEPSLLGGLRDVVRGVLYSVDHTLVEAIADKDHAKTMLFTVLIGAMVGIIGKGGGTRAVVEALARRAKSKRSVELISWLAGLVIFFDDYANCVIVGSAMGPLCDRHQVTRPKLAYIVDSTAAPVASLALVSTWVGYEVGVIKDGLELAQQTSIDAYGFFVEGWPFRFYPILALLFVGLICWSGRDFGPMLKDRLAHHRDRSTTGSSAERAAEDLFEPPRLGPWLAIVPIVTLIAVTILQLVLSGLRQAPPGAAAFQILQNADGYGAIVYGAFSSLLVALLLTVGSRALDLKGATDAAIDGMKIMFEAIVVLLLAWSLSAAMKDLHAPEYLVSVLKTALPAALLPTMVFLVGAAISFAVGSSYTTMGVMMPMVIPLAFHLSPDDMLIPLASSGSVLAGACFGDHCSPISDTTVLSSIGSGSDHLAHVRTQLPYALVVGAISVIFGTLPAGFGVSPWLLIALGTAASFAVLLFWGRKPAPPNDEPDAAEQAAEAADEAAPASE